MADDILKRLKKHTIKGRKRINGRHRYCRWCDIIDEIERLRAAGDALAVHWEEMSWTGEPEYIAWKEARRERP